MSKKVIAVAREFGSGGRVIAQKLAEHLGIAFYDKNLISIAAQRRNLPEEKLESVDEKRENPWRYAFDENMAMERQFHYEPLNDILFHAQSEIIQEAAEKEDCVIVGRCANHILREYPGCRSVFIYAPLEERIRTIRARTGLDAKGAEQLIKRVDKQRKYYYENYTDQKWGRNEGFDLGIDSSRFTDEQMLKILVSLYRTI
ncbi:MAG: AAA family ATPase [Blautia sp.]